MTTLLFWLSVIVTTIAGLIRGIDQFTSGYDMKIWLWPFMTSGWCLLYLSTELNRQRNLRAISELIDAYENKLTKLTKAVTSAHDNNPT